MWSVKLDKKFNRPIRVRGEVRIHSLRPGFQIGLKGMGVFNYKNYDPIGELPPGKVEKSTH